MNVKIKQLGVQDVEVYKKIRLEAATNHAEDFGTSREQILGVKHNEFIETLKTHVVLGAYLGDELCAIAAYYHEDNNDGLIFQMFVRPKNQRLGIAKKLLKEIIAIYDKKKQNVFLSVISTNYKAVSLYKKSGFEIFYEEENFVEINNKIYGRFMMVKKFNEEGKNERN